MRNGIPRIGLTYSVDQTSGYHLYGTIRPLINRYNKYVYRACIC